ncbi:MAG: DUF4132 domain-containing protein [Clostridia bacterium]|nr:DUF4132 domain-containing protein [Clostridia bacterium]
MEILRNVDQIYDKLNNLLGVENQSFLKENNYVFDFASDKITTELATCLTEKILETKKIEDLCSLIFQLNDYLKVICNITKLFLTAKKYDAIYTIVSKIFVAHIGTKVYNSAESKYFYERNFDRFIEIVRNGNIKNELYIPFLIEIYKCENQAGFCKWKNPALVYLQNFWNENENWFINFVANNPDYRYKTLTAILDFNTKKGVENLINDYLNNKEADLEKNLSLMKLYKRDVLFYIDNEISKVEPAIQAKFVEIMLNMDKDTEAMGRVKDIYTATKDEVVKELIANKMGIGDTLNIKSEKQFLNATRRKIKEPQERILGLPFDKLKLKFVSGMELNNNAYTFLIYLFKEEKNLINLQKLSILNNIFEKDGLTDFVGKMIDIISKKDDILQAKWCIRLISLLANEQQDQILLGFLKTLFNTKRNKEAKYLTLCLIYSKKILILNLLKDLITENNEFAKENYDYFISLISTNTNMNIDDIKDLLVPNVFSKTEFDLQKTRLFNAFICGKMYNEKTFKTLFFDNVIFKKLGQNLVFGEYRFGRLNNAFVLEDKNKKFLVGKTIFENDIEKDADILIGIIHPLDCDFRFEKWFNYFQFPTFEQFKKPQFNVLDYNHTNVRINRFNGVVVNTKPFCKALLNNNFFANKAKTEFEFKSMLHIMPSLNLICELEFEKNINEKSTYASLSYVCFYKLSDTLVADEKYIIQKFNALSINSIPYRYFDYVLSLIFDASKE